MRLFETTGRKCNMISTGTNPHKQAFLNLQWNAAHTQKTEPQMQNTAEITWPLVHVLWHDSQVLDKSPYHNHQNHYANHWQQQTHARAASLGSLIENR